MHITTSTPPRRTWAAVHIDAMRGLAALIVALGHARSLFFASVTGAAETGQLTIGDEAVIVFFVLSGYLVGGSVLKEMRTQRWKWTTYLTKRCVRLWIVLIPAIFIGIGIDTIGFHFLAQNGSIYSAPPGQTYVQSALFDQTHSLPIILGNIFFLQTIFVPTVGTNSALWSLANEFWYYLLFPIGMLAVRYERRIVCRIAYAIGAVSIMWMIGLHASLLFLTWLLGVGLAVLPRVIPAKQAHRIVPIAAVVFVVLFTSMKRFHLPLYLAEMAVALLVGALLYTIVCQQTPNKPSFYGWAARWTSNISYTLYLTHLPFLILLCALLNTPWGLSPVTPVALAIFVAAVGSAIAWAAAVYYVFESRTDTTRAFIGALIGRHGINVKKPIAAD